MRRPAMFFLFATVAAAVVAIIVYSALHRKDIELAKAMVTTTEVAVAARDLPLGTKIDSSVIKMVRWPRNIVPSGGVTDPAAIQGSIVKTPMVENEPIVLSRLFAGDKTAGVLPLLIPPKMRAMSVAVDEVSDIAGFVLPHSRVDVLVSLAGHGAEDVPRSKIVLENVEVLAVAQTIEHKDKPQLEKVVTLLVTPEEAERLALASHEGTLRLAMRNYTDDSIVTTQGTDVKKILGAYSPAQAPPARHGARRQPSPPKPLEIEVMRDGKSRQALAFSREGIQVVAQQGERRPAAPAPQPLQSDPAPAPGFAIPNANATTVGPDGKIVDVP